MSNNTQVCSSFDLLVTAGLCSGDFSLVILLLPQRREKFSCFYDCSLSFLHTSDHWLFFFFFLFADDIKVSVNDFIIKATAVTLKVSE